MDIGDFNYDVVVIGAGHAGAEAALATAKLGFKTLVLSVSLDNAGFLACNPSIGGTAKGHLVREIDALGGYMGVAADKTLTQLRMLNSSKGYAVRSLRAQVDKNRYHICIKQALEKQPNLHLRQGEAVDISETEGGYAVKTRVLEYRAKAVIFCCGVYLKSKIFVGNSVEERGPSGFARSEYLSDSIRRFGINLRRFKTGTPARIKRSSIDLSKLEIQRGESDIYSFSFMSGKVNACREICYLGYTNPATHQIIRESLGLTPRKLGLTEGVGARYCPSIEDKVERFDRERHQFFLEPEGDGTEEMYVQGISTSLPAETQLRMYRSIEGFERAEIMRDAYAIEYDCIDSTELFPSLMHKRHDGLFFAGQINGTSGYEEAAAQGLVAGINAARYLGGKPPVVFERDNSYIGVLIDDLVTKGTDEPYRMLTSRAEYRLRLRQDNADLRLTEIGYEIGLADAKRYRRMLKKRRQIADITALLEQSVPQEEVFAVLGERVTMSLRALMRRDTTDLSSLIKNVSSLSGFKTDAITDVFINERYGGYMAREEQMRREAVRLEELKLPPETDYFTVGGLRTEAAEKLNRIKPFSVAQASRISGVNPADVNVLIVWLKKNKKI